MGFIFFHWGFCPFLGILPGTGSVVNDIALENFTSRFFFALALGRCYSSSLLLSNLKVPAVSSCYKNKSVMVTIFILVDFYVTGGHLETESRAR